MVAIRSLEKNGVQCFSVGMWRFGTSVFPSLVRFGAAAGGAVKARVRLRTCGLQSFHRRWWIPVGRGRGLQRFLRGLLRRLDRTLRTSGSYGAPSFDSQQQTPSGRRGDAGGDRPIHRRGMSPEIRAILHGRWVEGRRDGVRRSEVGKASFGTPSCIDEDECILHTWVGGDPLRYLPMYPDRPDPPCQRWRFVSEGVRTVRMASFERSNEDPSMGSCV